MTEPKKHLLTDYSPCPFRVDYVYLQVNIISPSEVFVHSFLEIGMHDKKQPLIDLCLDGQDLDTKEVSINGERLHPPAYSVDANQLCISRKALAAAGARNWKLGFKVKLNPNENSALQGLYLSSGVLLTQCEAEGFRRISWFLDRPDVLSRYICRIEADRSAFPVLLSNGNLRESGELPVGRHYAIYDDPHPKPCYLFALVAGKLARVGADYQSSSGRSVRLNLYATAEQLDECSFALGALQRAMRFDEERYGLEYDLDQFNLVAVEDFNAGAMENKSLNIFNSACLLADPKISTDSDFERVEAIIAHEYFHNYSGNKVTLRDWFQLCWKEGLTVYRDQQFTASEHSRALKRCADVALIQGHQFLEDESSLRHAPQPQGYNEIDNLYTLTVYEKSAEIMRMLSRLLGLRQFDQRLGEFLRAHSGEAITIQQFLQSMLSGHSCKAEQFQRWFEHEGCVQLRASWQTSSAGLKRLTLEQLNADGSPIAAALPISVNVALLDKDGIFEEQSLLLDQTKHQWTFGCEADCTISLLRDFSAPVRLQCSYSLAELALLQSRESDPVSRWWANRQLWLAASVPGAQQAQAWRLLRDFIGEHLALGPNSDAELSLESCQLLSAPGLTWFCDQLQEVEPQRLHEQIARLRANISAEFAADWQRVYRQLFDADKPNYQWNLEQRATRAWQNLALLHHFNHTRDFSLVSAQIEQSDNFTDASAALNAVLQIDNLDKARRAATLFAERWGQHNHGYQHGLRAWGQRPYADSLTQLQLLMESPRFLISNPNHVHALIYSFARNLPAIFLAPEISLAFVEAQILHIDGKNPQLAARLATSLADNPKLATECRAQLEAGRARLLTHQLSNQLRDQLR